MEALVSATPIPGKTDIPEEIKPRRLSQDEINDILTSIPQIRSAIDKTSESIRLALLRNISLKLQVVVITPLGIPDLKDILLQQFHSSLIQVGSPVGLMAAEAMGASITQMALNSFHSSGSSKNVTGGVDAIKELIYASAKRKTPSCSIAFQPKTVIEGGQAVQKLVTFDDVVLDKRGDLVGVMISDVISSYDIDTIETFFEDGEPWWYFQYRRIVNNVIPRSKWILRLFINVNTLFNYKIQPQDVCDAIERDNRGKVFCVASPVLAETENKTVIREETTEEEGVRQRFDTVKVPVARVYVDIYVHENMIEADTLKNASAAGRENISRMFITATLLPRFDSIQIKGIAGIRALYPVTAPIWRVVKDEISNDPLKGAWFIQYNRRMMKITGITPSHVRRLCVAAGMIIDDNLTAVLEQRDPGLFLAVQIPSKTELPDIDTILKIKKRERKIYITPTQLVNYKLKKDQEQEKIYEEEVRQRRNQLLITDPGEARKIVVRRPPTELSDAGQYVYADTDGTDFRRLLNRDDIDPYHTISNNMYEILINLGIEAARIFLIKELTSVIEQAHQYINPRHIILVIDFMTQRGSITKITYAGLKKQPVDALAHSSFERATDVLKEAAAFGQGEKIRSTSTSIFVGNRIKLGTGYQDVTVDPALKKKLEKRIVEVKPPKLDDAEFKDAIEAMDDITFDDAFFGIDDGRGELVITNPGAGFSEPNPLPTVVGGIPPSEPILIKGRPVVPAALKKAADQITHVPQLPTKPTIEFEIKPLFGGLATETLPQTQPVEEPQVTQGTKSQISIPQFTAGIGAPNFLAKAIEEAMKIKLPPVKTIKAKRPIQARTVTTSPDLLPVERIEKVELGPSPQLNPVPMLTPLPPPVQTPARVIRKKPVAPAAVPVPIPVLVPKLVAPFTLKSVDANPNVQLPPVTLTTPVTPVKTGTRPEVPVETIDIFD